MTEWLRELAGEEGARFLPVVELIEKAADDPEWADYVSLLGLTCGTGKSSAVSLLIAETVHAVKECGSKEGLLIVTDRREALKEYLNPTYIPNLKIYLDQSADMISRLDSDTYADEKDRFWRCPVLLMTYKRYFGSEKTHIKNTYLKWGRGCQRTRIIMDEEPPIVESLIIGISQIEQAGAGIRNGLTITGEERLWCLETWEKIRGRLLEVLEGHGVNLFRKNRQEMFLYRAQRAQNEIIPKKDLARFRSYIQQSHSTLLEEDTDLPVLLEEILRIAFRGEYGETFLKKNGTLGMRFYSIQNHGDIMQDMGAKILILDGTAAISTAYDHEYIHPVPFNGISARQFPELTIKLVNMNTSKSTFSRRKDAIIKTVIEYLEAEGEHSRDFMVITYKGAPEDAFRNTHRYAHVEHLGNIRGRKDLDWSRKVAQVGAFRKPPLMYTLEWFDSMDEKAHGHECFSSAVWEYPDEAIHGFLDIMNKEAAEPYDRMIRGIAADFEQNVFRTAIRKPNNTDPVTCYLFADLHGIHSLSWLLNIIYKRFHDEYGSQVVFPDSKKGMVWKIIGRKGESAASRLVRWLSKRKAGEIFAKATMLEEAGLTENQFHNVKKRHPMIGAWFEDMYEAIPAGQPRRGYFMMLQDVLDELM